MTRFIFLFICLTFLFEVSNLVELECSYDKAGDEGSNFYRCENVNYLNLISRKRTLIDKHTGTHDDGMTDDNVLNFYSDTKNLQYFPQGLSKIFKNLNRIIINSNGLKELIQSDLKDYPKLEVLILDNNLIEALHDDLFEFNPDLAWISMENNFIIQIYPRVFEGLNKLHALELTSNFCINKKASNVSTALQDLIEEMKVQCSNAEFMEIDVELGKFEKRVHNLNYNNVMAFNVDYQKLYLKLDSSVIAESAHLTTRFQKIQAYLDVALSEFYQVLFEKVENLGKNIAN